jgi:hypothetical protein
LSDAAGRHDRPETTVGGLRDGGGVRPSEGANLKIFQLTVGVLGEPSVDLGFFTSPYFGNFGVATLEGHGWAGRNLEVPGREVCIGLPSEALLRSVEFRLVG